MKKFFCVMSFSSLIFLSRNEAVGQGSGTLNYQTCPIVTACVTPATCPANGSWDVKIWYTNPDKTKKSIKVYCATGNCPSHCEQIEKQNGDFTVRVQCPTSEGIRVAVYNNRNCEGTPCEIKSLPVTLVSFTAQRQDTNIMLHWETATEINNTGFEVEKNFGGTWERITFIKTLAPGGNSSTSLNYNYVDADGSDGVKQYRLKQIDIDGKFVYSPVAALRGKNSIKTTTIFPNPSNGEKTVNIVFGDTRILYSVSLIDISGKELRKWTGVANSLQVNGLQKGVFVFRISDPLSGQQEVQKIIVQ